MAKTKKSVAGRVVAAVLCILLLAVAALGGAWGTGYALTGEANPANWKSFKPSGATATHTTVAVSSDGQLMENGKAYEMPAGFTLLSARSFSSETTEYVAGGEITLTAGLSNEYINGKFDWSADWANPDAEWAQGKVATYYVALEPSEDGKEVTVNYLEPFSEQIIIIATLQGSDSSDSCTIDCLYDVDIKQVNANGYFEDYVCCDIFTTFGAVGTVKGDVNFKSVGVSIDIDFQERVKNFLNFDIKFKRYTGTGFAESEISYDETGITLDSNTQITPALYIDGFDELDEEHQTAIKYAWYAANKATGNGYNSMLDVECNYNYSGTYIRAVENMEIVFLVSAQQYSDLAPSVTLNKNVVF